MDDIFLNTSANRATAESAWKKIEAEFRTRGRDFRLWKSPSPEDFPNLVKEARQKGATRFIAAGGDGTLQMLLDVLVPEIESRPALADRILVGSLGIGTSNDFHKPISPETCIAGFPAKINVENSHRRDITKLTHKDSSGATFHSYFCQNSSVGVLPNTNHVLTRKPGFFHSLYKTAYAVGMPLASLYMLFRYPGFEAQVRIGAEAFNGRYTGITILKCAPMAGDFTFFTRRTVSDGLFDVALCAKISAFRSIALTAAFEKVGFVGHPEVVFRETAEVSAVFRQPQLIDIDGELLTATEATWKMLPGIITFLG
jgi:diacylglycerol kinase family enzyme